MYKHKKQNKMKFLHEAPQTKTELVNQVANWYQAQIESKGKSTVILEKCIGHISKKQVSVKIQIKDEASNIINVYFTPKSWWVKKVHKGQSTGFSKAVCEVIESHVQ